MALAIDKRKEPGRHGWTEADGCVIGTFSLTMCGIQGGQKMSENRPNMKFNFKRTLFSTLLCYNDPYRRYCTFVRLF